MHSKQHGLGSAVCWFFTSNVGVLTLGIFKLPFAFRLESGHRYSTGLGEPLSLSGHQKQLK